MKNSLMRYAAVLLAFCFLFAGVSFAAEETVKETVSNEEAVIRLVGAETAESIQLKVTNLTGKEINYISVFEYDENYDPADEVRKMQEALIEQKYLDDVADGSYGPKTQAAVIAFREAKGLSAEDLADAEMLTLLYGEYDDGNLLKEKEVIADGETVLLSWNAGKEETSEEEPAENLFAQNPDFRGTLKFADDEKEYSLHSIPVENAVNVEIHMEDDIVYLIYQTADSDAPISTIEAERAAAMPPQEDTYYDDYYYEDDYYYDYSADYSYDYSYEDTYYYEEPQGVDGCVDIDDVMFNP